MKNQNHKQVWFVVGLLVLASTLSIISYLVLTQFVAFLLQVAGLLQQGSPVTVTEVFTAIWQTFGAKILIPAVALGSWFVVAELFTQTPQQTIKKHGFYLAGATIVLMAIMLGLTWETFADVPMIAVVIVPAVLVAVFGSLNQTAKTLSSETASSETAEVQMNDTPVTDVQHSVVQPTSVRNRVERRKTKKRQRTHRCHTV